MIPIDYIVLFYAVPCSMIIITTIKKDKWNLTWIFPWSLLLFIGNNSLFDIFLFILGLFFGYLTDIAGVYAKKWWYPHYHERTYSLSAGYGWGIITLIIFRTYFFIQNNLKEFEWIIFGIFGLVWLLVELKKGKTSLLNYYLILRSFLTVVLLYISGEILFIFVAAVGAIFLEVLGTELRVWIYYDSSPSYIHLGTGYAQLSYLCYIGTNLIINRIDPSVLQILLVIILILLYLADYKMSSPSNRTNLHEKEVLNNN